MPSGFSVLSEIPEATAAMLDSRIVAALAKFANFIDYIHISDQYNGAIQQEDPATLKQPEVKRMLMAGFNLPKNTDMESVKPLLVVVFYILERLKRFRLSKEVNSNSCSLLSKIKFNSNFDNLNRRANKRLIKTVYV